jgi:hypothetical protein
MRNLTPYDTGQRAEPKVWELQHRESDDDFGKVDFNTDVDYTIATLHIEKGSDGTYTLRGYANELLRVEIEQYAEEGDMSMSGQAIDRDELREMVKAALNAKSGDAEWSALVQIGDMVGLEYNQDEDRYE